METVDAAGSDMERGLLVATPSASEEGQLSQDTPSRNAPTQATWEAQDATCTTPVVAEMTENAR